MNISKITQIFYVIR